MTTSHNPCIDIPPPGGAAVALHGPNRPRDGAAVRPPWETTPNPNTFAYRRPLAVDSLMSPPTPDSPAGGARPWRPATRQIDLICLRLHEEGNIFRWATLPFFSATVHFIPRGFVNRPSSAWLHISIWNRNFLTKKPIRIPNHFFLSLSLSLDFPSSSLCVCVCVCV